MSLIQFFVMQFLLMWLIIATKNSNKNAFVSLNEGGDLRKQRVISEARTGGVEVAAVI